ncbi:unnamed protein product [Allacma fusca]|uniref:Uncharacterized protein n=1 Tax=Allacma fusca TaxID=39272 RepID=A0A8J2KJR5_9HEXA|nr:unnamed protein product [Allacma fusca]
MSDSEEQKPKDFQPKKWPQLLAGLMAANGAFALGTVLAWPSPCIPELIKSKEFGDLRGSQPSWLASLAILGASCSAIPAGRDEEAASALKWLKRAKDLEEIEPELKFMQNNVKVLQSSDEDWDRYLGCYPQNYFLRMFEVG